MEEDAGCKINTLKVDGGATANNYLMQYQANILNSKIILPECLETTSLGVAYLAGLGSGYFKDLDDIKKIHKISKEFYPLMEESERAEIDKKWAKAIEATRVFK